MYASHSWLHRRKHTGKLAAGLIALAACFGLGSGTAHADRWEIFDQGEHLFLPEGPIEVGEVVMLPLRPVAERFGYTFTSVTNKEIVLTGKDGRKAVIRLGTKTALLEYEGGAKVQLMAQIPRNFNGAWFIDLALAGAMGGQGHSTVPGTNFIQLRPVSGDAKEQLERQYWFSFKDKGQTVFVNNQGQEQLQTVYTSPLDFGYDDLLPVKKSGYTAGYMNRAGELAIDAPHYQLGLFSEGLAWFKDLVNTENGGVTVRMGYMNRAGKVIIPGIYNRAYDFSDGLAKVTRAGKTYYINHNGQMVIPPIPGLQNSESFSDGLAAVTVRTTAGGKSVLRTGFIDTAGKWAIKPIYESATPFSEGIATATVNGKSGLINTAGKWIVKPQYSGGSTFLGQFRDGHILLTLSGKHDYTQRLVDTKGKIITVPGTGQLTGFGDDIVSYNDTGGYGFKTFAGAVIVKPMYSYMSDFKAGAGKGFIDYNDVYEAHLINKAGKVVWSTGSPASE
ncbi:WG repeat-containing protein [Paenibacillus sp. FSL K6-1096]|uniref:WG repeat-containing protein n=1 Tax=Paenibacillus sp. FSL K6-1096 TaxID=2921460 RepID=UPI0030EE32D9